MGDSTPLPTHTVATRPTTSENEPEPTLATMDRQFFEKFMNDMAKMQQDAIDGMALNQRDLSIRVGDLVTALNGMSPSNVTNTINKIENYAKKPDAYDGDRSKYQEWKRSVELYTLHIAKDADRIQAALSYMTKGDAEVWQSHYWDTTQDRKTMDNVSWEEFIKKMDKYFKDPNIEDHARIKLGAARLKKGQPIQQFFAEFDILRKAAKMTDAAFDDEIIQHLKRWVLPKEMSRHVQSTHDTTKKANTTAAKFAMLSKVPQADVERQLEQENKLTYELFKDYCMGADNTIRGGELEKLYLGTGSSSSKDPDAMDIDKIDRLSREDKKKATDEKLCFNCMKKGHLARDCWKGAGRDKRPSQRKPNMNFNKDRTKRIVRSVLSDCSLEELKGIVAGEDKKIDEMIEKHDTLPGMHFTDQ